MAFGEMFKRASAGQTPEGKSVKNLYEENRQARLEKKNKMVQEFLDKEKAILEENQEKIFAAIEEASKAGPGGDHEVNIFDIVPELKILWEEASDTPVKEYDGSESKLKDHFILGWSAETTLNALYTVRMKLHKIQKKFSVMPYGKIIDWQKTETE